MRATIFGAKKMLKGSGITVTEDLTHLRQKSLKRAREVLGKTKVWTQDGNFFWVEVNDDGTSIRQNGNLEKWTNY